MQDTFEWADAILSAGGDGTFLSTASLIRNRNKPIIGINTDPTRFLFKLFLFIYFPLIKNRNKPTIGINTDPTRLLIELIESFIFTGK